MGRNAHIGSSPMHAIRTKYVTLGGHSMNEEVKNTNSSWSYLPLVLIVTFLIFFTIAICKLVAQPDTGFALLLIALPLLGKYF